MTNLEWLQHLARTAPDELRAWFESEHEDYSQARLAKLVGQRDELQEAYDELVGKCAELCAACGFAMVDASGEVIA